ncbi:4-hydroxy-tetrahydrodipicolinate synthase [Paraburkholderia madseniana]|uniref:4-hydroxy-tetrahydrodipicolinate synthase n=1 Tax=Paraburkholderia madseniana TaxID=2599607 RepID=UPI0015C542F5|nr:4-hydroxy-tetrahydrodipicolinate synthase [Paraburkholderia madseniana]NPT68856.1 4-hydroxy-tetrahydrodipicolinate synthase [Paraburkholderia madseniana]
MSKLENWNSANGHLPRGSIVALITPFTKDGSVDWAKLRSLIDLHIDSGTAGIAVAGTTGESSTLSHAEHCDLISATVEHAAGRIHVMAGVGANSTSEAVALAKSASDCGADSLLSVVPYYVKPSQQGLLDHFSAQADAANVPLVLYNVPGRTATDMSVSTVVRLSAHPNIRGLKDATGDMVRASELVEALPTEFALYSGDDFTSLPFMALGGCGVISVVANILPKRVNELCQFIDRSELKEARSLFVQMLPLTRALFAETSPGPVKFAASLLGQCEPVVRLPLVLPEESTREYLQECLREVLEHAA